MADGLHIVPEGDGVLVVEIDNPPMNVLNAQVMNALGRVLDRVENETDIRALVLIGRGRAFCAGEDLKELSSTGEELRDCMDLLDRLEATRVPVIAAVNGFCAGAGLSLIECSDIRLASDNAVFICAGVNIGMMSEFYRLARIVGVPHAKEMLYTGDKYDAAAAVRSGLVTHLHTVEELRAAAVTLARRIATRAPLAVEATKRVAGQIHLPPEDADALFKRELMGLLKTRDQEEGFAAFKERRSPVFRRQ